jgi:tetratricopeptide (TPR) repeat protein
VLALRRAFRTRLRRRSSAYSLTLLHEFGLVEFCCPREGLNLSFMGMPFLEVEGSIPDLLDVLDRTTSQLRAFHPQTVDVVNRLAIAFWKIGDVPQAIGLLEQAIEAIACSGPDHPVRSSLLCTLAEIMVEQARWDRAAMLFREVLDVCIRRFGSNHASSLAAKGDLALVLFELGQANEASELEREASESAREHLGKRHTVTCVLAWNRAVRLENNGDANAARTILVDDLVWLLTEEDANLETDHLTVKAMLAKRWGWQSAAVC